MQATCSICGDIFTGMHPEEIHSTKCGHLFHLKCLMEWLKRSKTCPQCRSRTNETDTVRLYFQISTYQNTQDSAAKEVELQNLRYDVTLLKLDLQKQTEDKEEAERAAKKLRATFKEKEEKNRTLEASVSNLQEKIKVLKHQVKSLNETNLEMGELKKKLEYYRRIEFVLYGSSTDATKSLAQMNDKDVPTLCNCISALKKEIEQLKEKNRYLQIQLKRTEKRCSNMESELDKLRGENSVLNRANEKLKSPSKVSKTEFPKPPKSDDDSVLILTDDEEHEKYSTWSDARVVDLVSPPSTSRLPSPSPASPILFKSIKAKSFLNKSRLTGNFVAPTSARCYDGLGGHVREEVTRTDRATLLREIEHSKTSGNKLQLARKRIKTSAGTVSSDLRNFYPKKL